MRVCSSQQMRKTDTISINDYKIPGIVLMENAAIAIKREIEKGIHKRVLPQEGRTTIICGSGNNGGDGFALGRHLISIGWSINVFIVNDISKITSDARINYDIIKEMGVPIHLLEENDYDFFEKTLNNCDLIVDGILGTGFKGDLKPHIKNVLQIINKQESYKIAIDIPTGLNSDTGFINQNCLIANKTVTLGLPKTGLLINDGPIYSGELVCEGLTIPEKIYESLNINRYLLEESYIKPYFKARKAISHKGDFGRILTIAGSEGMAGAGLLAAEAALKSGSGIVELAVPKSLYSIVSGKIPELITQILPENSYGGICLGDGNSIIEKIKDISALIIGPGIASTESSKEVIFHILRNCNKPMVIDADGLNVISKEPSVLLNKTSSIVLTPHPKEMARLMGTSLDEIQKDRIGNAEKLARKYNLVVVLKGHRTIIATPENKTYINPSGNPGMATAGSGDVLSGMIGAFMGQGLKAYEAAISAVYLHGLAGDKAAEEIGQWGMTASDIIRFIPYVIREMIN